LITARLLQPPAQDGFRIFLKLRVEFQMIKTNTNLVHFVDIFHFYELRQGVYNEIESDSSHQLKDLKTFKNKSKCSMGKLSLLQCAKLNR
jgi:hypothetical protein